MAAKPGVAEDQGKVGRPQDMEPDGLMMCARQEHRDGSGLMGDGPQEMTVQGAGRHGTRKRNPTNIQLSGEFLVDQVNICPRVNEGGEGVRPPRQQKLDMK